MSLSDRVTDLIAEGANLAIRIGVSTPNPGLICRTLRHEPLVLCASPAYLSRTEPLAIVPRASMLKPATARAPSSMPVTG